MEDRFGHDFGGVRIHTGAPARASANSLNALAFTVGQQVVFGAGQFAPETGAGRHLLAHELAHTVQQQNGAGSVPMLKAGFAIGEANGALERQAESTADAVINGVGPLPALSPAGETIQRAPADAAPVADSASELDEEIDGPVQADPRAISSEVPTAVEFPRERLELVAIHASAVPGEFARYEAVSEGGTDLAPGPVFWRVTASPAIKKVMKIRHLTRDAGATSPRPLTQSEIEQRRCNVIEIRFDEELVRFGGQTIDLEVSGESFSPGGGDEKATLKIRGVKGGKLTELESAGKAGDVGSVKSLLGASPTVLGCDPDQEKMIFSALGGAVSLASKALARLGGAQPSELLRKKLFAPEHPVRMALRRNFFPSKGALARLDLEEVQQTIDAIKPRITRARNDLLTGGVFKCSSDCETGTCARPEAAASVNLKDLGRSSVIDVCHPFFACSDHDFRVRALFHEAIHRQGVLVPKEEELYRWDRENWTRLRTEEALKMADSYALFIWEVVKGKKTHGSLR